MCYHFAILMFANLVSPKYFLFVKDAILHCNMNRVFFFFLKKEENVIEYFIFITKEEKYSFLSLQIYLCVYEKYFSFIRDLYVRLK